MEHLQDQLNNLLERLPDAEPVRARLENLVSVFPFNEYEFIISHLLASGLLSLDDYYELRDNYLARNLFLYLFEISAPRTFGESWAQGHLKELVPDIQKPSKKRDPNYTGQYDFLLENIRVEVKASRAVDASVEAPLYVKALASDSQQPFWMNFQQIKPACCDVFVWIAVWRDTIMYWVQSSHEVENNVRYSKGQHRGNLGEGQLHLRPDNIRGFDRFRAQSNTLREAIVEAYRRELEQRSAGNNSA